MSPKRLLYVGYSPIQNNKPYELFALNSAFVTTSLYMVPREQKHNTHNENVNQQAFVHLPQPVHYKDNFLPQNFSTLTLIQKFNCIKAWILANDIVVVFGHNNLVFKLCILLCKLYRKKLVLVNDATYIEGSSESSGILLKVKPLILRLLYNQVADGLFVPSTASKLFFLSLKIRESQIAIAPYVVDEDIITKSAEDADVAAIRARYNTQITDTVFVFCAKFIDRKRPLDAIEAFSQLSSLENCKLWLIGDGPLIKSMKKRVEELNLQSKITFCGIVSYNELGAVYASANCLVFTSSHEPYGLPVNEALLSGIPVIVSDRIGARLDLVEQEKTGWIYPCGNITELATILETAKQNPNKLLEMGEMGKKKMLTWSSSVHVQKQIDFFSSRGWL